MRERYGDVVRVNFFNSNQVIIFNPDHVKKLFQGASKSKTL